MDLEKTNAVSKDNPEADANEKDINEQEQLSLLHRLKWYPSRYLGTLGNNGEK
jgi:hypothetical protein